MRSLANIINYFDLADSFFADQVQFFPPWFFTPLKLVCLNLSENLSLSGRIFFTIQADCYLHKTVRTFNVCLFSRSLWGGLFSRSFQKNNKLFTEKRFLSICVFN